MSIRDIQSVYSSHLAKYISERGHEYNDAILVTKTKKKYPVYKVILAVRSDFFKCLFLSDEDHSTENEAGLEEFPLPTVSDEGLLPILHWLYHGEMDLESLVETVQEVLESAEFLGVSPVRSYPNFQTCNFQTYQFSNVPIFKQCNFQTCNFQTFFLNLFILSLTTP